MTFDKNSKFLQLWREIHTPRDNKKDSKVLTLQLQTSPDEEKLNSHKEKFNNHQGEEAQIDNKRVKQQ